MPKKKKVDMFPRAYPKLSLGTEIVLRLTSKTFFNKPRRYNTNNGKLSKTWKPAGSNRKIFKRKPIKATNKTYI